MHHTALYASLATLLGITVPAAGQAPPPLDDPGLLHYVGQVLENNAALAADGADLRAAVERIAPAGALPDPTLFLGMMSVPVPSFDFDAEAMTQLPIGIRQSFPFPGKQGARTAVARGDSALALARVELTSASITSQAAQAFFELAFARSALSVWEGRLELADQAITTATARYETGRAPQADLLRAELSRAGLEEERHQFGAGRAPRSRYPRSPVPRCQRFGRSWQTASPRSSGFKLYSSRETPPWSSRRPESIERAASVICMTSRRVPTSQSTCRTEYASVAESPS